jgi:hypothetical protein
MWLKRISELCLVFLVVEVYKYLRAWYHRDFLYFYTKIPRRGNYQTVQNPHRQSKNSAVHYNRIILRVYMRTGKMSPSWNVPKDAIHHFILDSSKHQSQFLLIGSMYLAISQSLSVTGSFVTFYEGDICPCFRWFLSLRWQKTNFLPGHLFA